MLFLVSIIGSLASGASTRVQRHSPSNISVFLSLSDDVTRTTMPLCDLLLKHHLYYNSYSPATEA